MLGGILFLAVGLAILAISVYSTFCKKPEAGYNTNNFPLFSAIVGLIFSTVGINLIVVFAATT